MAGHAKYEYEQSEKDGLWYWHLKGKNGEIEDRSSEGFKTKEHAEESVESAEASSVEAHEVQVEGEEE